MNTDLTFRISSTSSEVTEQLGRTIGAKLKGGEVIELSSDLGGGKTTFTRGLVAGAGSNDAVASPTFTISKVYQAPSFAIHHFDFYRLAEAGIMSHELDELLGDDMAVIVVEWAGIVSDVLPTERVSISFMQTGDDTREITMNIPQKYSYLAEGIQA